MPDVPAAKDHRALEPLRRRLAEEEAAYAEALAELDRFAAEVAPAGSVASTEVGSDAAELATLNALAQPQPPPAPLATLGALQRRLLSPVVSAVGQQAAFNAALVRLLNAWRQRMEAEAAAERLLAAALVRYAQRVEPVMDARDQVRVAESPTDAALVIREFERRLAALQQRLDGLLALRDRAETLSEELKALRAGLAAEPPAPAAARAADRAAQDAPYTAFENRFRGSRDEIRARQADYVALLHASAPVVDLGCGRGELLDALRAAGVEARGVEGSASAVAECRTRGLDVVQGDLVEFLRAQASGSLGAVFAAQVAEHLKPEALQALLAESHRALRQDGLLVVETVNAASALAFLDVYIRDLTHERPLHPETLRFLAAAAGFVEARVEWRSPVPDDVKLRTAPSGGLAPPVARVFNENVERLNALLFAPLDYVLVARR